MYLLLEIQVICMQNLVPIGLIDFESNESILIDEQTNINLYNIQIDYELNYLLNLLLKLV